MTRYPELGPDSLFRGVVGRKSPWGKCGLISPKAVSEECAADRAYPRVGDVPLKWIGQFPVCSALLPITA